MLQAIADEIFEQARATGAHESPDAYRFDAIIEMARRAWDHMSTGHTGDDTDNRGHASDAVPDEVTRRDAPVATSGPTAEVIEAAGPSGPAGDPAGPASPGAGSNDPASSGPGGGTTQDKAVVQAPRARRRGAGVNPKTRVVLRVDLEALVRGRVDGEETCGIAGVGPVPVRVARDLLGDATLHLVVTRGVEVANVTYLGRGPNAAQRIALLWTATRCARLGCHRRVREYDHRDPYANRPETTLDNIDGLCSWDHDLKTYDGWALLPGDGKREMVPPTDPRHPGNPTFHKRRTKTKRPAA